jgi:hypothetical protein
LSHKSIDISSLLAAKQEIVSAVRIRGFLAASDLNSCVQFQEGHLDVLRSFGFKVSSTKEDWMSSKSVYVIIVESLDGARTYGGARVELANVGRKLAIQNAIESLDGRINSFVNGLSDKRSGELCGLWNSVAVAGLGIGSVYSIRAAIAMARLNDVRRLLALCSVHSYKMASSFGFKLLKEIGEEGVVYYEGARQNAHITFQSDLFSMMGFDSIELEKVNALVLAPNQKVIEERNGKSMEIHYELNKYYE